MLMVQKRRVSSSPCSPMSVKDFASSSRPLISRGLKEVGSGGVVIRYLRIRRVCFITSVEKRL